MVFYSGLCNNRKERKRYFLLREVEASRAPPPPILVPGGGGLVSSAPPALWFVFIKPIGVSFGTVEVVGVGRSCRQMEAVELGLP